MKMGVRNELLSLARKKWGLYIETRVIWFKTMLGSTLLSF